MNTPSPIPASTDETVELPPIRIPRTGYVRRAVVLAACGGISRVTLWRWIERGFPRPIRPTLRTSLWDIAAVHEWLAKQSGGAV